MSSSGAGIGAVSQAAPLSRFVTRKSSKDTSAVWPSSNIAAIPGASSAGRAKLTAFR
jgi:hypothetical protein